MSKIKAIANALIIFTCYFFLFNTMAQADGYFPEKPYYAKAAVISDGVSTPMVMHVSGQKMRIEVDIGSESAVQIIDFYANKAFMLTNTNGQKMAVKISTKGVAEKMGLGTLDLGRSTGQKKIANTDCKTYKTKEGIVCLTKDNIVLESIGRDSIMRVSELNIGRQRAHLFDITSDYKVMNFGSMTGMNLESFSSNGVEHYSRSILEGIANIVNAKDDDSAGQAAIDSLMGKMGGSLGGITTDDTTAGVLNDIVNTSKSDADKQKEIALIRETERQMQLIEKGGIAAMLKGAGMSEEQIRQMEATQMNMAKQLEAHANKHKEKISSLDVSAKSADASLINLQQLQTEMDTLNQRAKAMLDGGDISVTDQAHLQKDAEDKLKIIFGGHF